MRPIPTNDGPRINDQIKGDKIRLVDQDGEMIGVVSIREGLDRAIHASLDLVEISPTATPPVCKILDMENISTNFKRRKSKK